MKLQITDYLLLIGIVIVLIVGIFLVTYYFNYKNNECFSNPLVFGAKQMEEQFDGEVSGRIFLIKRGLTLSSFYFDAKNISQEIVLSDNNYIRDVEPLNLSKYIN